MILKRDKYPNHKTDTIVNYTNLLNKADVVFVLNYKGSTVEELTDFRKNLAGVNSKFKVIKNRLTKIALNDTKLSILSDKLSADTALVIGHDDVVAPAKIIINELNNNKKLKLIGGIITDDSENFLEEIDVVQLSKIASREQLLVKLVYCLNSPITGLVRTLNEIPTKLVRVLDAISKKAA
ncbi:MAG: 50S ribosomal protein L10 [SAR324 cluster bacterium]|nr:50S ribosomal protein L10 [SAR324 cluster bacterium]